MGSNGLTCATKTAILSANYIAKRLSEHYEILFTGKNGLIAHECIIDIRPIDADCGVAADDIAKRLMDYGFHAPTMSFPVPGTLMIEPTESESLSEIDKFCDAMIAIKKEINQISKSGHIPMRIQCCGMHPIQLHMPLLRNGTTLTAEEAVYPLPEVREHKYWPPVGRIDGAYGDKNLVCSCPNIDEFEINLYSVSI